MVSAPIPGTRAARLSIQAAPRVRSAFSPPHQDRGGLDSQLGPPLKGLLRLVQSQEMNRTPVPKPVAGVKTENRGGSDLKEGLLFPARPDAALGVCGEKCFRGEEGHLPHIVVDDVVLTLLKEAVPEVDPFAPIPDSKSAQGKGGNEALIPDSKRNSQPI